jgi:hypothetical protein
MDQNHHHNYNLTTKSREEDKEQELNPLPRAVSRANVYELLDGSWQFSLDRDNRGIEDRWFETHQYTEVADWPGSIEEQLEKHGHAPGTTWNDSVIAWYERTFPHPGRLGPDGQATSNWQITFGACGYETMVWLNGRLLTTTDGAEVHVGEYTSFSYEIPNEDWLPVNKITVRIADSMDADTPRGKQESHVYKRGGIWYQTYTGAVRSIWLETVERNRLRSRIGIVSTVEDNLVRINLTTRVADRGHYRIRLKVYHRKQPTPTPIAEDVFPVFLEPGQKIQRVVIAVPDAQLWSPENPHLYRLIATLIDEKGHEATIEGHFGLRKIEARGNKIYLNHKPVYLDGILYQPGTATYDEIKQHMYSMKELGCNLVRIHIAGVDPRIYNLADKLGMLLWVEVPSPHNSNQRSRENHREELLRMLALMETHPSIIIWSLYNEDWGAQDIDHNPDTQKYIVDMYHYMQIHHPQFLVIDNDGWKHISQEGRLKSDLLTAHLYMPDPTRWRELLDDLVNGKTEGVAAFPLTVGDPFFYRRQVPLVVSEWGGFGFADYGGPKDEDDRVPMIAQYKKDLRSRPIAGDVYTQATNIEDERNGLIDAKTGELRVPAGLLHSEDPEIVKQAPQLPPAP